jgi:uncharacterized protein
MMSKETLSFELKSISVDEPGTFEGSLSTYGNKDLVGDIVERGAFTKTLKENGAVLPLLLNHNPSLQVGILKLNDSPNALVATGKINLDTELGRDAYSNLKFNFINSVKSALSIGFRSIKDKMEGDVRHLLEIALHEGSLTLFPANQQALINAVKSEVDRHQEKQAIAAIAQMRELFRRGIANIDDRKKYYKAS